MKTPPKYWSLEDGAMATGSHKYKYTCVKCGKPYLDAVYQQTYCLCNRCLTGRGRTAKPIVRGAKRHRGGIHTGKPTF